MAERRMRVRVWLDASASATPVPNRSPQRVWNLLGEDISLTGIRLLSPESFPVASRLRLEIDVEGELSPIQAIGTVVWIGQLPEANRWRIGLKFTELSDEARLRIGKVVSGRPPSPSGVP
ncbi:MAG: PilZ domain-containing protein [Chromatiales bacterium]|jgi:hypothetical protein